MKSNIKAIMKKAVIFALVLVMGFTFDAADVFAASPLAHLPGSFS